MNSQWPSSQYSPGTVLISHILDSYSHFQACPLDHRIRIRFLFEQLLYRLIDINSFWRIADFLDNRIRPAAEIVVTLATNPEKLRPGAAGEDESGERVLGSLPTVTAVFGIRMAELALRRLLPEGTLRGEEEGKPRS